MKKENNMMWTRFELKERGKAAFQRNYWRSVLVAFILMLFVSGGGSAVSNSWNQITSSGTSDEQNTLMTETSDTFITTPVLPFPICW